MWGNRSYNAPYNNGGSYGRGSGRGYSRPSYGGGNYQGRSVKKHSGCRFVTTDRFGKPLDKPFLSAWRYDARLKTMFTLTASDFVSKNGKTKVSTSESGKTWKNLFVLITNRRTGQQVKCFGMFNVDNQKLYIKDLNMICNPRANNGGYFGKHISKRY